jgi:hypothetical protein
MSDYPVLYADSGDVVRVPCVKHHQQASFDADAMWLAGHKKR